ARRRRRGGKAGSSDRFWGWLGVSPNRWEPLILRLGCRFLVAGVARGVQRVGDAVGRAFQALDRPLDAGQLLAADDLLERFQVGADLRHVLGGKQRRVLLQRLLGGVDEAVGRVLHVRQLLLLLVGRFVLL